MAERPFDQHSPDVLLQVRINLPVSIVLARYIERFELQRLWYPDEEQWVDGYPVPAVNLITAHRTYPQRATVILTFTQPMAVWRKLRVSRSITFLECVTEDNVVGNLQMTYLLTRASRRVNEGPLSLDQFKDDMRRACLAIRDGKGPPRIMGLTLPQVLFTARLSKEYLPLDDDGEISWQDIDRNFNSTRSACPKFVSERPCDEGAEVTFIIPKYFWPYIEAISETYRFAGYVDKEKCKVLFPNYRYFTPTPEPEPPQAPLKKATEKVSKKRAKEDQRKDLGSQRQTSHHKNSRSHHCRRFCKARRALHKNQEDLPESQHGGSEAQLLCPT